MKSNNDFKKLQNIVNKTHEELKHDVIIKKGNEYSVYSEYNIVQNDDYWEVTTRFTDDVKLFGLAKSALAWCIAYKSQNYNLANLISVIDRRLLAKQTDIDVLTYLLKQPTRDPDITFVMQCRLSEDIHSRQSYKQQLAKLVNSTKYIKIKGSSDNELKRFTKTG